MEVFERLRDELQWYRDGDRYHRGGRMTFEESWETALTRTVAGLSDADAKWWRRTFEQQKPVYRRSWLREPPTAMDVHFAELIVDLGLASVRERRCRYCGASLEGQRPNKRFCSLEHRKAAWWARHKPQQRRDDRRLQVRAGDMPGESLDDAFT
jgi:hypothetical protein